MLDVLVSRLNLTKTRPDEEELEEDEGEPVEEQETIHIFDPADWESYLKNVDVQSSTMTLQNALQLPEPMHLRLANWLELVRECGLFVVKIWQPQVKLLTGTPLLREDLEAFVESCASGWANLAVRIANGAAPFHEMEDIFKLGHSADCLAKAHLHQVDQKEEVNDSYRDFQNLQQLRHLIGPFVAALRYFTIKERKAIDELYEFINTHLVKNWKETTLAQVYQIGIIDSLNSQLNIDPNRCENLLIRCILVQSFM